MEKTKYFSTWPIEWVAKHASPINDFVQTFEDLAKMFKEWIDMGKKLHKDSSTGDDYAEFYTEFVNMAIKAGFTVGKDGDNGTVYLLTQFGEEEKVPKES